MCRSTDHVPKIRPPISETPCIFKTLILPQQLHTYTAILIFKSTGTFNVQNILQPFIYCILMAGRDSYPGNDLLFAPKIASVIWTERTAHTYKNLDIHGSVHRRLLSRNTKNMLSFVTEFIIPKFY
jgi:hypothetical protein